MKQLLFSLALTMLFSMSLMAQNLIENPGFEAWTGDVLDTWIIDGDAITVTQNTTTVHEGSSSADVLFTSQDNQQLKSNTFGVTAGDPIAVNFWVYDNDNAGRARLTILFEGGDNYYGDEYSEDMDSWQLLSYTGVVPDGATEATFQIRFYDVADNWDGDCQILVDESSFIIDDAIKPEPSNYPTDFLATVNGVSAQINWVDATGDQLPQKYLILASTTANFTAPVDGTPVADDTDMSDGNGAMNIAYGAENTSFSGLNAGATYHFTIFPYTNAEADIDFKTDGEAPITSVTMPNVETLSFVNFEDDTFGDWTTVNAVGDLEWYVMEYSGAKFAVMSGYDGGAIANEDWIISPAFDNDLIYTNVKFSFSNAMNYSGPNLQVFVSTDYDGGGDPNTASWIDLSENFAWSTSGFEWVESGEVSLNDFHGSQVYIAIKYTSDSDAAKWEVDNLLITGVAVNAIPEQQEISFKVYPNPSNGVYHIANTQQQEFVIDVYNLLGKQVSQQITTSANYDLDISDLENGMYLLQITSNKERKTISLIKK